MTSDTYPQQSKLTGCAEPQSLPPTGTNLVAPGLSIRNRWDCVHTPPKVSADPQSIVAKLRFTRGIGRSGTRALLLVCHNPPAPSGGSHPSLAVASILGR